MNSASSTEPSAAGKDAGMQPWHFFLLLAMLGATVAVIKARDTHPASLILLSAAILAAGGVAIAAHSALTGFFGGRKGPSARLSSGTRAALEAEKALVLRSIKELEFDRAMRKVSDADFDEIGGRLRARALDIMEQLERPAEPGTTGPTLVAGAAARGVCRSCQTANDADATFCKHCGTRLA